MPRKADAAVILAELMIDLTALTRKLSRSTANHTEDLSRMFVGMATTAATAAGTPPTVKEIAERVKINRNTVRRRLEDLEKIGQVTEIGSAFIANMDRLDEVIGVEDIAGARRIILKAAKAISQLHGELLEVPGGRSDQ